MKKEETGIIGEENVDKMDSSVLRAVYALNMCTVSVSQIIDYNDVYILEQEYDAILNNLNLEKMPKADALKNILVELLNTITFFRIQEMRKKEIEKKYQNRIKNAIWSAIPNLNMIVAGNPAAIVYSIATQVGIGYMSYRKERNTAYTEKEKEELELRITAIEQFNALRRELFTTAWELAEEYQFDDRLRLTEKQIRQYNNILIDQDELRKYMRLDAIKENFEAFPPFWYFFGHTACYIAGNEKLPLEDWERNLYREKAKEHFCHYEKLNKFNILREDQMTASFALEYVDLLLLEENPDYKKIKDLITVAEEMSGNAFDVKELCAFAYLKIGETTNAAKILMRLVNEEYNMITNAKLLSRIYVSQFINGDSKTAKFDYKTLKMRLGEANTDYLFPMPEREPIEDKQLQKEYLVDQKIILQMDYRQAINELAKKYTVLFNAVIPAPYGYGNISKEEYYGCTESARQQRIEDIKRVLNDKSEKSTYLIELANIGFRFRFIDLLNEAMESYDELKIWREAENHDYYWVRAKLVDVRPTLKKIQDNMDSERFSVEDYNTLQNELSFKSMTDKMREDLEDTVVSVIDSMDSLKKIEMAEYDLTEFCQRHNLSLSNTDSDNNGDVKKVQAYLSYDLFGKAGMDEIQRSERRQKMCSVIKEAAEKLILGNTDSISVLFTGDEEFNLYFQNTKLAAGALKIKTLAIIEDDTKKNCDFVLTEEGVLLIKRNDIKDFYRYGEVTYNKSEKGVESLKFGFDKYSNTKVDIGRLYNLIQELRRVSGNIEKD